MYVYLYIYIYMYIYIYIYALSWTLPTPGSLHRCTCVWPLFPVISRYFLSCLFCVLVIYSRAYSECSLFILVLILCSRYFFVIFCVFSLFITSPRYLSRARPGILLLITRRLMLCMGVWCRFVFHFIRVCVWMYVCVCERAFECLLCARSTRCVSLCVAYVRDAIFGSKKAITRIIRTFCEPSLFRGQVIWFIHSS